MDYVFASNTYDLDSCCGNHCFAYGRDKNEPCWGQVHAADEVEEGEGNWVWIHECEGHDDCWDDGGKYKPEG